MLGSASSTTVEETRAKEPQCKMGKMSVPLWYIWDDVPLEARPIHSNHQSKHFVASCCLDWQHCP